MDEAQLLIGCAGDFQSGRYQVRRFIRANREAQGLRIGDHKAVATVGGVDLQ
ncbi:hypothetical protein D3C78_1930710 [compost metagenome]